MSIIARLIEAGVAADLIEEVAVLIAERNLLERGLSAAPVEKVRSTGALRTQRYRERKAAEASQNASQSVTCDAQCDDVTVEDEKAPTLPLSPNDLFSNPQTPTHPDNIPTREAVPFEAHVAAWLEWQATKPKRKRNAEKPEVSSGTPDRPEDVSEQVWADFLKHRRKHGGLTATALKGFRREADRVGWPLERAIEESILRNWRGFKADWVKTNDRNGYGNSGFGAPAGSRFQPEGGIAEGLRRIELARNHGSPGEAGRWDDHEPEGGYLGSGS